MYGSRRGEEADFGAKSTFASLPQRLRLLGGDDGSRVASTPRLARFGTMQRGRNVRRLPDVRVQRDVEFGVNAGDRKRGEIKRIAEAGHGLEWCKSAELPPR